MSISIPFFGGGGLFGGSLAPTRPIPFTVALAGKRYPIDLQRYRSNGLARFRQGIVGTDEPSDQLLSPEGGWWRYRISWHLGAGQDLDELDEDAQPERWSNSRGIDPWDQFKICLQEATEEVRSVGSASIQMVATGTHLYVSDGSTLIRSPDLSAWETITGITGTIGALSTDGTDCYVAASDVYVVGASTTAAALGTTPPVGGYDRVAFVANRLLAASGNQLFEVASGSKTSIVTHFQSAFAWNVIFAVGSRIYIGGFAGNRSELYTVTTDSVGNLVQSAEAASFFSGELLQNALSYGGFVILCTSAGIRFAQLGGDATLQYGPVISDPGSTKAIAAEGRFAWFGWEAFPGAGCGVGRLALDEFVAALQPPYATDVFTEAADNTIEAVARFKGRTVFAVASSGIYASIDGQYVTSGYLDSGEVTMGTVEDKSLNRLLVRFEDLETNETVGAELLGDDASIENRVITTDGADELVIDVVFEPVNRARVILTLTGDGTTTPCVTQWRLRAMPIAPGVQEWLVPLIIQSRVVVSEAEGQVQTMNPYDEVARIIDLWQRGDVVLYQEGEQVFRVRIDNYQIDAVDWRDDSTWLEVTCTVRLLAIE